VVAMLHFLFWGLIAYFGYHFLKGFFSWQSKSPVKGKSGSPPLDLKDENVEDAKFKDIEES
jgi:hypothetical protein